MSFLLSQYANPFEALRSLQDNIDKFWWEDTPFYNSRGMSSSNVFPPVNIFEKDSDQLVLMAELPGIAKEDLEISIKEDVITLAGKRVCYTFNEKNDNEKESSKTDYSFHRRERNDGEFDRSFRLPYKVDPSKVNAQLTNGVLTIAMEKAEEAKAKQIQIK